jgi:hypothetical protein
MTKRRLGKWAGYISTVTIYIVGVTPSTFKIPGTLRPWMFVFSIVWVVVFCSGVFN